MSRYKDATIRNANTVVRTDVDLEFSHIGFNDPGTVHWTGRLYPPNNTGLIVGQTYTLLIPVLSAAKILITEEPNPVDGVVLFRRLGDPPKPVAVSHATKR